MKLLQHCFIGAVCLASSALAEGTYATSSAGVAVSGDVIASTFLATDVPANIDGGQVVSGDIFTREFGQFKAEVILEQELIDSFAFPETTSLEVGGRSIALATEVLQSETANLTRYLVNVQSEDSYLITVVDDPSPFVALLVLAAIPYAACGAQQVWNKLGSCEPGATVTFDLGIASCSVTCGG